MPLLNKLQLNFSLPFAQQRPECLDTTSQYIPKMNSAFRALNWLVWKCDEQLQLTFELPTRQNHMSRVWLPTIFRYVERNKLIFLLSILFGSCWYKPKQLFMSTKAGSFYLVSSIFIFVLHRCFSSPFCTYSSQVQSSRGIQIYPRSTLATTLSQNMMKRIS